MPDEEPRREAVARYHALVAAVMQAIDAADPVGLLGLGCPADEHAPEVGRPLTPAPGCLICCRV